MTILSDALDSINIVNRINKMPNWSWLIILAIFTLAIRVPMLDFVNIDLTMYLIPWYDYISSHGGISALGDNFSNYTPPYLYLLYLATLFDGLFPKLFLIKTISIVFDFVAAFVMYKLVRLRFAPKWPAWLAFFCVVLAPTVVANGAFWGQSDALYSSLLLACLYFAIDERPFLLVLFFGLAFSVKGQAIFLSPFLLMHILKGRLPWYYLLIIPVVYVVMMIPAAILGRPWSELLTVYFAKGHQYKRLAMNAPNLYSFLPRGFYFRKLGTIIIFGGATFVVALSLTFAIFPALKRIRLTPQFLVLAATLCVTMVPFFLPKMHDRYFFTADLFSIALAFYNPALWFVPVVMQCISFSAYGPYLFGVKYLLFIGALLNAALVIYLGMVYFNVRPQWQRISTTIERGLVYIPPGIVFIAFVIWLLGVVSEEIGVWFLLWLLVAGYYLAFKFLEKRLANSRLLPTLEDAKSYADPRQKPA